MRTDLTTEPVVVTAQTQTALNPVACGKIVAPNQVMGFQIRTGPLEVQQLK